MIKNVYKNLCPQWHYVSDFDVSWSGTWGDMTISEITIYLRIPKKDLLKISGKIFDKTFKILKQIQYERKTRPEVSEADPGNQKVTKSKVSKLRPAHRNSKVNM